MLELSQELLTLLPNDVAANQTHLVALIKTKQFKEALDILKKMPQNLRDKFAFEHAYILHRNGDNKEAFDKLKASADSSSEKHQHLLSQINYKLSEYEKSSKQYAEFLKDKNMD